MEKMDELYPLVREALGDGWPLPRRRFLELCGAEAFVEPAGGVAFAALDGKAGHVLLCAVRPEAQGRGVGSRLLGRAEAWMREAGARTSVVGRGPGYLWQGAPEGAQGFFLRNGYALRETSWDLAMDLQEYHHEVFPPEGVAFRLACREDEEAVFSLLEAEDLRGWRGIYGAAMRTRPERVLLAVAGGEVLGLVILETDGQTWEACFPGPVGGFGCLGVGEAHREKGVGLSLAAEATRRLREEHGIRISYVGWTWLKEWYGRLGYRPWRAFHTLSKELRG